MGLPSEFMLTDVRCFAGEQRARLRPITLLVGENSTGKTTFLGCYSVFDRLFDLDRFPPLRADFNREPFAMGSFRDIVRARRGPQGRINSFSVGLKVEYDQNDVNLSRSTIITFDEDWTQPKILGIRYEFDDSRFLDLTLRNDNELCVETLAGFLEVENPYLHWLDILFELEYLISLHSREESGEHQKLWEIVRHIPKFQHNIFPNLPEMIPVAPLRSKPKRTYDPVQEIASPEGDHVPMLMMRLNRTDERRWRPLHQDLAAFGKNSGMFSEIKVRRHGKQMSDPFQLQIRTRSGTPANIMDVGYGVSQSLPILVDIHSHQNSLFLLQQPEAHLHPRAQAELATVFAESVRENGNSFMIETHSDHIVDRTRILVRQGKIPAEDVSILYFEPVKNAVRIHNIEVDNDGNLENVPSGYRDFFLRESDRLLGFED